MTVTEALVRAVQPTERGWIIRILADHVIGQADATTVRTAMALLGVPCDTTHFRNHVEYLSERGYIRMDRCEVGGISNTILAITADGRDLRSGVRKDQAVSVDVGD